MKRSHLPTLVQFLWVAWVCHRITVGLDILTPFAFYFYHLPLVPPHSTTRCPCPAPLCSLPGCTFSERHSSPLFRLRLSACPSAVLRARRRASGRLLGGVFCARSCDLMSPPLDYPLVSGLALSSFLPPFASYHTHFVHSVPSLVLAGWVHISSRRLLIPCLATSLEPFVTFRFVSLRCLLSSHHRVARTLLGSSCSLHAVCSLVIENFLSGPSALC